MIHLRSRREPKSVIAMRPETGERDVALCVITMGRRTQRPFGRGSGVASCRQSSRHAGILKVRGALHAASKTEDRVSDTENIAISNGVLDDP
jgi:hypothetical protein